MSPPLWPSNQSIISNLSGLPATSSDWPATRFSRLSLVEWVTWCICWPAAAPPTGLWWSFYWFALIQQQNQSSPTELVGSEDTWGTASRGVGGIQTISTVIKCPQGAQGASSGSKDADTTDPVGQSWPVSVTHVQTVTDVNVLLKVLTETFVMELNSICALCSSPPVSPIPLTAQNVPGVCVRRSSHDLLPAVQLLPSGLFLVITTFASNTYATCWSSFSHLLYIRCDHKSEPFEGYAVSTAMFGFIDHNLHVRSDLRQFSAPSRVYAGFWNEIPGDL